MYWRGPLLVAFLFLLLSWFNWSKDEKKKIDVMFYLLAVTVQLIEPFIARMFLMMPVFPPNRSHEWNKTKWISLEFTFCNRAHFSPPEKVPYLSIESCEELSQTNTMRFESFNDEWKLDFAKREETVCRKRNMGFQNHFNCQVFNTEHTATQTADLMFRLFLVSRSYNTSVNIRNLAWENKL